MKVYDKLGRELRVGDRVRRYYSGYTRLFEIRGLGKPTGGMTALTLRDNSILYPTRSYIARTTVRGVHSSFTCPDLELIPPQHKEA